MLYYLRLWRRFARLAWLQMAEFRVNLLIALAQSLIQIVFAVLPLLLIYRFTNDVSGWSEAEMLMLAGVFRIAQSLIWLQIGENMQAISRMIREGELDLILLRPASSQFLVSVRELSLLEGVQTLIGIGLVVYGGQRAGVQWSIGGVATALLFGLCGLVLIYTLWFCLATSAIWLTEVRALDSLMYTAIETARYPVSFFRGAVRTLLTFVVPVAFATTFPTTALLGAADLRLLAVGIVLAGSALMVSNRFWNYALRHYSSASS